MRNTKAYPDAGLRDLVDHWVLFRSFAVDVPPHSQVASRILVGFLYVDSTKGFVLRVEQQLARQAGGAGLICRPLAAAWHMEYRDLRCVSLRKMEACLKRYLGLPDWPSDLSPLHSCAKRSECRQLVALDPFRLDGDPDVVKGWVARGGAPRGREVLLRIEEEAYDGSFQCRFLSETLEDGYEAGEMVSVVYLHLDGAAGMFCLPTFSPSLGQTAAK